MKILTLSIKQNYFDEILSGDKKQEFREVRPTNAHKYINYVDDNGTVYNKDTDVPEDVETDVRVIEYDAIKFLTGAYSGTRPYMIVKVKFAELQMLEDEDGEEITYEHEGREYAAAQMCYTLGDIIENPNI